MLAQLLAQRYRPSQAPRSFTRQDEIDQMAIVSAWYQQRRDGLCYVDLPASDPSDETAACWAAKILDGDAISGTAESDVAWEVPENEREQQNETCRHRVEKEGGAEIIVGLGLGLAG